MNSIWLFTLGLCIGIVGMGLMAQKGWINDTTTHKEVVSHGCGEYNSITAKFQWKESK